MASIDCCVLFTIAVEAHAVSRTGKTKAAECRASDWKSMRIAWRPRSAVTERGELRGFPAGRWIDGLAALDGVAHVEDGKRQVGEALGLTGLEAELGVPALQIDVLADDPDADLLDGVRLRDPNDVSDERGADTALAASGQNRETVEVGETGARACVGDASNRAGVLFGDEISLAAHEVCGNPGVGAERRMLWAVVGVQAEFQRDIAVGAADERCDRGDVGACGLSDLHWREQVTVGGKRR